MTRLPYYRTDSRRQGLITEARSWLGTPFAENCAVRGPQGGVDCTHLVYSVHRAAGAIPQLRIPPQPVERVRHWGEHHAKSMILDWFGRSEHSGLVTRIEPEEPREIGDVVVLKFYEAEHHLGIWCGHMVIHVAIGGGVMAHSARDPELSRRVRCCYRVMEVTE